jgi:hypothetical protein
MWLAICLVLLVSFGALGAAGYFTYRLLNQTSVNARMAEQTRVVEPAKLAILTKAKDAEVNEMVNDLKKRMPPQMATRTTSSVIAGYGTLAQHDVVVVIAFSTLIVDPAATLDRTLLGMTNDRPSWSGSTPVRWAASPSAPTTRAAAYPVRSAPGPIPAASES